MGIIEVTILRRKAAMSDIQFPHFSKEEQISALIEQLSAYIEQYHGGTVELVAIEGDKVKVHLGGACESCPLLPATLQGWVAGTLRQFFPEVNVVAVDDQGV
jgi:Fe-S cluster biogenesis protein NfuA